MSSVQSHKPILTKYKHLFTLVFSYAISYWVSENGKGLNSTLAKTKWSFYTKYWHIYSIFMHFPSISCTSRSNNFDSVNSRPCPRKLWPSFLWRTLTKKTLIVSTRLKCRHWGLTRWFFSFINMSFPLRCTIIYSDTLYRSLVTLVLKYTSWPHYRTQLCSVCNECGMPRGDAHSAWPHHILVLQTSEVAWSWSPSPSNSPLTLALVQTAPTLAGVTIKFYIIF